MRIKTVLRHCPLCQALMSYPTLLSGNTAGATLWTDGKCEAAMLPLSLQLVIARCASCSKQFWIEDAKEAADSIDHAKYPRVKESYATDYFTAIESNLARNSEEALLLHMRAWWYSNDPYRIPEKGRVSSIGCIVFLLAIAAIALAGGVTKGSVSVAALCLLILMWVVVNGMRFQITATVSKGGLNEAEKEYRERFLNDERLQRHLEKLLNLLESIHMPDAVDTLRKGEVLRQLGRFEEARQTLKRVKGDQQHTEAAEALIELVDKKDRLVRVLDTLS